MASQPADDTELDQLEGRVEAELPRAPVIQLRPIADRLAGTPGPEPERLDSSFDVALDQDDDQPPASHPPVYVDVTSREHTVRPIIPANLRGVANVRASARRAAARGAHIAGYHAVRTPKYALLTSFWAVVGLFRLAGRQIAWWWVTEQHQLRQTAATNDDPMTWEKLTKTARQMRLFRGLVLLAELVTVVAVVTLLATVAPPWLRWLAAAGAAPVVVPILARIARPAGRPIVQPAIVKPRFRRLNSDIVLRAYCSAGLGHPDKPDQRIEFGSTMSRDALDQGSQVIVDLPYGKTFDDAIKAKSSIASGLDVTEQQVYLTRDKTSTRRHLLFVADVDPLAIPAGRTPMLDGKPRDIWQPCWFGLDERGRRVTLLLLWISVLVGAQPRKGKTFSARLLALYAALDPYVKLIVVDGKMSPDWDSFRLVAHRYVCGTVPNSRDDDPIGHLLDALREIKAHIQEVNDLLSKLPTSECPEGKLTRDLSHRYPQLRVWMLVMEEFQVYFETDDQDVNKEIAGLLSFIMAVGPSAGVIILSSSQKPSGVGAGDVARLFNRYRDNHAVRFALKCGNRIVSEAVLGGDAYADGYDASSLPIGPEYRGVGYLYGASDDTPTVRTHLADAQDTEKILRAARAHRERAGTLTGLAAGEDVARDVVDPLADARSVFHAGEAWVSWPRLAARLDEQMPDRYHGITAEAVSARLRALGVEGKAGRDPDYFPKGVGRGCALAAVEAAAARKAVSAT